MRKRKAAFDRVQQIVAEQAPILYLVNQNVLAAVSPAVKNAHPVVLRPVLWLFPHTSEATLALIHFLIRKAGHLTEYAILALLTIYFTNQATTASSTRSGALSPLHGAMNANGDPFIAFQTKNMGMPLTR